MKRNEIKDLQSKNTDELRVLLKEARSQLVKLRLESQAKKSKNVKQLFFQRKKIARFLTILREKETANA